MWQRGPCVPEGASVHRQRERDDVDLRPAHAFLPSRRLTGRAGDCAPPAGVEPSYARPSARLLTCIMGDRQMRHATGSRRLHCSEGTTPMPEFTGSPSAVDQSQLSAEGAGVSCGVDSPIALSRRAVDSRGRPVLYLIQDDGGPMFDRPVKDVMRREKLLKASPETVVGKVAKLMESKSVGVVMVIAEDRLVGICTERDIVFRVVAKGLDADTTRLADVMTPEPHTIAPEKPFGSALLMMHERGFRHLPSCRTGRSSAWFRRAARWILRSRNSCPRNSAASTSRKRAEPACVPARRPRGVAVGAEHAVLVRAPVPVRAGEAGRARPSRCAPRSTAC